VTLSAFGVEDTRLISKDHHPPKKKVKYLTKEEWLARKKRTRNAVIGGGVGTLIGAFPVGTGIGAGLGYGLTRRQDRMGTIKGRAKEHYR
jgi:hypothetical protein